MLLKKLTLNKDVQDSTFLLCQIKVCSLGLEHELVYVRLEAQV